MLDRPAAAFPHKTPLTRVTTGATRRCVRFLAAAGIVLLLGAARHGAQAADGIDLTVPLSNTFAQPTMAVKAGAPGDADAVTSYFSSWSDRAAHARATQPTWSSPLVTTTGLLEQRVRFDLYEERSGNGTNTALIDGGRGLDLIVGDTSEIQIAAAPYLIRSGALPSSPGGKPIAPLTGFADWPFLRLEQRLASSPASDGNYVLTTWLQIQSPTGIAPLTNSAWTYLPTLAFGKGWGAFDIQATVGGVLPAAHAATLGHQIQTNVALQYHVLDLLWPQIEVNWTYYPDGQRGGLNQVYLTPGLVVGRFSLSKDLKFTLGVGYQIAVAPQYRANPLAPAYNNNWVFTTRLNF
jgi:hypothetical protein